MRDQTAKAAQDDMNAAVGRVLEVFSQTRDDDPLVAMCRALVAGSASFRFVAFVRADEEVWYVPCAQPDCRVPIVPVDVERSFVRFLKDEVAALDVLFLREERCLPFIPKSCRTTWECHSCAAFAVSGEQGADRAILVVFFEGDCPFTEDQRAALRQLARSVSVLYRQRCDNLRLRAECAAAQAEARQKDQTLASVRGLVRSALVEFDERVRANAGATVTLADLRAQIVFGLSELVAFAGEPLAGRLEQEVAFDDPNVANWVQKGLYDARVKMIVGVRGANKTGVLRAVRSWLRTRGIEEPRLVNIDFEDVRFRRFETMEDVLDFLRRLPPCDGPRFLFLNEIGRIGGHVELLRRLSESREWNVWVASSTAYATGDDPQFVPYAWMSVYQVWPRQGTFRSRQVLERIWCQIFLRDVVSGVTHPDIEAKAALAEYFSDHLGEMKTLREIAEELNVRGRKISPNSIRAYRTALMAVYLVEVSEVYDTFERSVVRNQGGRVFWTDLELRNWRFGAALEYESARTALNELYLTLRQTHDKVYTPRGSDADFLTLERDGSLRFWYAPLKETRAQNFFRWGYLRKMEEYRIKIGYYLAA